MKKADMIPSHDNLIKTLLENSIGRNEELYHLIRILNSIEGSYSIAIDGRWGSGKTFFVRQAKMLLDAHNEFTQIDRNLAETEIDEIQKVWIKLCKSAGRTECWDPVAQVCVYFDAWEYDGDENPIASLLYQISKEVSSCYRFEGERNYLDIASGIMDCISGKKYGEAIKSLKATNIMDISKERDDLRQKVNKYFDNLLPEHGERLILFIDELDRCNPRYAVALLEKLKHYFDNDKITFVFSVNLRQLQYTIQQYYGHGFDAYKYLDRFFDIIIPMPAANWNKFYTLGGYESQNLVYSVADLVIKHFKMEMREVSRYLETLRIITSHPIHDSQNTADKVFCYGLIIPVALALYKTDLEAYENFVAGEFSKPLVDVLTYPDIADTVIDLIMNHKKEENSFRRK